MSVGSLTPLVEKSKSRIEIKFRRGLWIASALAALAILACCFTMLRSENELSPPESVVSAQSQMLAHDGTLYYDLKGYPYTVCAYMPIFYFLEARVVHANGSTLIAGRMVSFIALLGLIAVCWRIVMLYTGDRYAAWTGSILVASSSLLMFWGTVGQVDTLAVFFAVMAFYQFSRYCVRGESTLVIAGVLAGLALFTKQTMVSAPAAVFVVLWMRDKKAALKFGMAFAAGVGGLVLGVDRALGGRFLTDTIFANMNPMSGTKLLQQLQYFGSVSGCLVILTLAALGKIARPMAVYLAFATMVFLATASKIGSDSNYQIEITVVLAICAAIGLHELNFFSLSFSGSKHWSTLLLLPLAVHAAVGDRVAANIVIARWANEALFRSQIEELRPFVNRKGGHVLSTDFNAMARLRGNIEVEPLIYGLLVSAGRIDPEPVRRDLAAGAFTTVILGDDVFHSDGSSNLEITSLPAVDVQEIRKHYRVVKHIAGPYRDGVYVYQPVR